MPQVISNDQISIKSHVLVPHVPKKINKSAFWTSRDHRCQDSLLLPDTFLHFNRAWGSAFTLKLAS